MKRFVWMAIVTSIALVAASHGNVLYSENFSSAPTPATGSSFVYYNGSSSEYWVSAINFLGFTGDLSLNTSEHRGRGAAVWLDASAWVNGTVAVEFDVSDYDGSPAQDVYFQAYYANGVDASNRVGFDLHQPLGTELGTAVTGTAAMGTIGSRNVITANGTDLLYSFDYAGQDYIALVFYSLGQLASFDNITVTGSPVTVTWDGSGDSTWTNPDNTSWTGGTYLNGAAAQFLGAGLGTVTTSGTISPGSLLVNSSGTYTIVGTISGTGALIKNGTGQLNLSTNNSFTGGVTVNDGTLGLENGAIGANGPLAVNGGYVRVPAHDSFDNLTVSALSGTGGLISVGRRTFTVNQSTDTTYAGIIQNDNGVGGNSPTNVRKQGTGTLTLSGLNTYNGTTTINGGALEVSGALFSGGTRNGITLNGNGSALRVDGAGYLGPGGIFDKNIVMNNASIFEYNSMTAQTLSGIISGTGTLTKDNTSTLTLSGANTYTGTTTVSNGTLKLQGSAFFSAPRSYSVAAGAILNLDGGADIAAGTTVISGAGTLLVTGGILDAPGSSNDLTISLSEDALIDIESGGQITNGGWQAINWNSNNADLTVDGTLDVWDGTTVQVDALNGSGTITKGQTFRNVTLSVGADDGSGTFSGSIGEGGGAGTTVIGFTKSGSGTQTLSGTNTYSGTTNVNAGELTVTGTTGSGAVNVASGATLSGTGTIGGTVTIGSGGILSPGL